MFETLQRRGEQIRQHIEQRAAEQYDPAEKLMAVLLVHAEMLTSEGFHGCPLVIAAVQAPESSQTRASSPTPTKRGFMDCLHSSRNAPGLKSPDMLASSLVLILEGAAAMSAVQPADLVARHARAAIRALIAAHTP